MQTYKIGHIRSWAKKFNIKIKATKEGFYWFEEDNKEKISAIENLNNTIKTIFDYVKSKK